MALRDEETEKLKDALLASEEHLDGKLSPELWPEPTESDTGLPGIGAFIPPSPEQSTSTQKKYELDIDGFELMQELSTYTVASMLQKVKELQNLAFVLGTEEAREMTRGRFLNILGSGKKR